MRCVVCHHYFENNEEYLHARIFNQAYTSDKWPYSENIDEWDAIVCGKDHLLEYIEKTI